MQPCKVAAIIFNLIFPSFSYDLSGKENLIPLYTPGSGLYENASYGVDSSFIPLTAPDYLSHQDPSQSLSLITNKIVEFPATEFLDQVFGRRIFNCTNNFIIPLFQVSLPMGNEEGTTYHLAFQAVLGLFSMVAWLATITTPAIVSYFRPFGLKRSFSQEQSFPPSFNAEFIPEKLRKEVGLDWKSCFKKAGCQMIQRAFKKVPSRSNKVSEKVVALVTRYANLPDEYDCDRSHPCFFDVLSLAKYLFDNSFPFTMHHK